MIARDYQIPAIRFLKSNRRGILEAPAGSGKTFIGASALAQCLAARNRNGKPRATIKLLCNTIEQWQQWENAFGLFVEIGELCDYEIGCAAGNMDCSTADLLIVDEAHHCGTAATWQAKVRQAQKARWALSATPWKDEEHDAMMRVLFGDKHYVVERSNLVKEGHLAPARVIYRDCQDNGTSAKIEQLAAELIAKRKRKMPFLFRVDDMGEPDRKHREQIHQCRWQAAQQVGLWDNEYRDHLIVQEANTRLCDGHHVIVLVGKIEHGERLIKAIPGARLCYSGMGRKARRETLEGFKSGAIRCIVGTSLLEEGFDAPIADCLIVASAGKSFRKVVQTTGRVLRKFDGKDHGIIIDFKDSFFPMLARQSAARRRVYKELNYFL